ncbi:MAG: hypothetical protein DRJ98_04580 [Thermoprotei archaeon]|nr:MAG: hypothetical protein DRJ98_04580 [Thermoprotei archaeon]RLF16290.1 MAG: hypothetical protein DRN06_05285 [Thermoprotei archaeon]
MKVYVKEDGAWLYFKFELAEEFPKLPLDYEDEMVVEITCVLLITLCHGYPLLCIAIYNATTGEKIRVHPPFMFLY